MSLVAPNLDDRSFQMLVNQATRRIQQSCPTWTDLSLGDPGMVLLEALAYLVEADIFRVNRLPEKAYVEFLRLMGVTMQPPAAARGTLAITLPKPTEANISVPRGTRVATARSSSSGESPVFSTAHDLEIPAGQTKATVDIIHCETVIAELLGKASGEAGLSFNVARVPIIAETGDGLDLVIGVEALPSELTERAPAIPNGNKMYRIWTEVENFASLGDERCVYMVDRVIGKISFPPAQRMWQKDGSLSALEQPVAAVPAAGREIRAWYRCGGGPMGNVNPGTITVLKDPLPGKPEITNPEAVTGGRSVESLEHALVRGPRELHALDRAVTARDFELLALRSGGVARAKALTKADRWKYARPGTVEIVIVPSLAEANMPSQQVTLDLLARQQTEATRKGVLDVLNERRPLGTDCNVCWTKYKTVRVEAKIEARAEEDITLLKARLMERLAQTISPLPAGEHLGWRFGQSLSVSAIYDACLKEPGVRQVLQPQVIVESVPDTFVRCLAVDPHHGQVWYAANKDGFFRSENDGNGWELFKPFSGEYGTLIKTHPRVPGLLALCTNMANDTGTAVLISNDCGESWEKRAEMNGFVINNAAWITRDGTPSLMMATNKGLYELAMQPNAAPVQIQVRPGDQDTGFHTVVSTFDAKGNVQVAVAARNKGGVFLSDRAALTKSFRNIGMAGKDVQVLATQDSGTRTFLWAGLAAPAIHDPGEGCLCWELLGAADPPDGWKAYSQGWTGGSCTSLSFAGDTVFAGTYEAGVLKLSGHADNAAWQVPPVNCGLPRGVTKDQLIERIDSLAVQNPSGIILIGGNKGVFRSTDQGNSYVSCSSRSFTDAITIPANWLFCSGNHSIEIRSSNEPGKA